jgi:glutamate dehydrogenase
MTDVAEQVKDALLDALVDLAERRGQTAERVVSEAMLRHYFDRVAPQDLSEKDPIDLYGAAVRHIQLAERRQPGETLVRVYNPNSDEDGWTSSHTVIDIVGADMPFIVDSVLALVETFGLQVHVLVHPMVDVVRSAEGDLQAISPRQNGTAVESLLHIEVDRVSGEGERDDLVIAVRAVLEDVRAAVEDWMAMRGKATELADELEGWANEAAEGSARFEATVGTDPMETAALLRWMEAGSFTFIGYREYDFIDDPAHPTIQSIPETGLGTLRQREASSLDLGELPPETAARARQPTVLNLTKANAYSTVHRAVPLDYVGIKRIDPDGTVTGERRFIGLFTSTVYTDRVQDLPVVRAKVESVIERTNFERSSHDHSRLLNTLQLYPRDELFQIEVDVLAEMALDILDLRDRRQVSLLLRRDTFGRFLSCMVFVPRDRHSTDVRLKIQQTLMEVYRGTSCRFSTEISDAPLARLHLVIYTDPTPEDELPDPAAVQARLAQVTRNWDDFLRESLIETNGEDRGLDLLARYGQAFDAAYVSNVLAESAVYDIERLEGLDDNSLDVALHRPLEARRDELRCKLYRSGDPITLTQFIPVLHDLGAIVTDERPYEVHRDARADGDDGDSDRFIYDIGLRLDTELDHDGRARFSEALLAVWRGEAESDRLARLVVTAGLSWRDVTVLRAYTRYLIQIGSRFSPTYVMDTLNQNPDIARLLIELFRARFDPECEGSDEAPVICAELLGAIDSVVSLDADRILRLFVAVITGTSRTNYWQVGDDGAHRPALAFKLDPSEIPGVPKPLPAAEIWVSSPRTEGVHLRSGRVARGGLRWSDRMEDFRTEILGLMKAQTAKNSVIVPVGAKGGFVARQLPLGGAREAVMAEVIDCYKTFVGAMLDVTDNSVGGEIVSPPNVVRHDDDDPYLVVAADKGTATFSDTANAIAEDRDFWLGDAFASGGSVGYDHKALGITARGAWVSVERHFRELGVDVSTSEFTAVGIGDMSGDVFGNGMLRSDKTRLIAAFDHRHVFVDPSPEAAASFAERQRLYDLPRSSWEDYDTSLISEGGGVFPRDAKSIATTPQMVEALGLDPEILHVTPDELIAAVLRAPVDLIWNGGIGTYVKASSETDTEIGDRSNDSVRVDANELRCKVVGEGGNLGVSQLGRVEFAMGGGLINNDAIDNSAGVDCSDHEVNLKILLSLAERAGDLTRKQRNQVLESMADDVCDHVLRNNYAQNETLAAARAQAPGMVQVHQRLMTWLENEAGLERVVEALPSNSRLKARRVEGQGLTTPELAVVLAHTKNLVTEQLVDSDLAKDPVFEQRLLDYFPPRIREEFPDLVAQHPLRTELIATMAANDVVNRGGTTMIHRLIEETSATVADIVRAHTAAWRIFDLDPLLEAVRALDNEVPASIQTDLHLAIRRLAERASRWLLRNEPQPLEVERVVERYRDAVRVLHVETIEAEIPDDVEHEIQRYVDGGVSRDLATRIAALGPAFGFLDLSNVADRTQIALQEVATLHAAVDERLGLSWLRERIIALPRDDHWQTMARSALRDEFFREHASVTESVLRSTNAEEAASTPPDILVVRWLGANQVAAGRCRRTFADIQASGEHDLAHASVAVRALSQLSRTA